MKIDLHIHTRERSFCAGATAEEQIEAALCAGLDAIAITDHERLVPREMRQLWLDKYPGIRILPGIELSLAEDILVVGLEEPRLEEDVWTWPELHRFVRERGGLLVVAHPFRYQSLIGVDCVRYPPDALEAFSVNLSPRLARSIHAEAARIGIQVVSNSDAHVTSPIGKFYNRLHRPAVTDAEILAAIRAGHFQVQAPSLPRA